MASFMDRIRQWLGVEAGHSTEHRDIRAELTHQQMRLRALDAYVEARGARRDRRHTLAPVHPHRRANDR